MSLEDADTLRRLIKSNPKKALKLIAILIILVVLTTLTVRFSDEILNKIFGNEPDVNKTVITQTTSGDNSPTYVIDGDATVNTKESN